MPIPVWRITKGEAIVASDVGQHQMWEAQYYHHERPRSLLTSGGGALYIRMSSGKRPATCGAPCGRARPNHSMQGQRVGTTRTTWPSPSSVSR